MKYHPLRCTLPAVAIVLALLHIPTFAQQIRWEPYGQISGGTTTPLAADAEGRIYAGASDRVFISTDRGDHWSVPGDGTISMNAADIHTFPTGGHVLAGGFQSVFLSTDAGVTWDSVTPGGGLRAIAIDAKRGRAYVNTLKGTWRSTDQGEQWELVSDTIPVAAVRASLVDTATGNLFVAGSQSILRSEDGGETWNVVADNAGVTSSGIITSLLLTPGGSIFASGWRIGAYRSTDGGDSWSNTINGLDSSQTAWTMASAPGGRLMVVNDTGDVYFSDNNGDVWGASGSTMGNGAKALLFLSNTEVLAGFYLYGLEKSVDGGESFAPVRQGTTDNLAPVSIGVDAHNRIYASNGWSLFRNDGGEDIWRSLSIPKSELSSAPVGFGADGWIVAGTLQSEDDGASWRLNYSGIDFYAGYPRDMVRTATGQMAIATSNGLYFITYGESRWAGPRMGGAGLNSIAAGPGGTLFTGGILYMMARSTDNGLTWEEAHNGLSGNQTNDIAADRFGNVYAATTQGIYRSTDTGGSWSRVRLGPDSTAVFVAIAANPRGPVVAATGAYPGTAPGTVSKVYSSDDGGITWVEQSAGLEGTVSTLALDSTGRIYAGMVGGRIFRTEKSTTTLSVPVSAGGAVAVMALSVSPNPVRAGRIRLSMPTTTGMQEQAKVTVHNLLGEAVLERNVQVNNLGMSAEAELEIESLPGGSYQVVMNYGARRGVAMVVVGR